MSCSINRFDAPTSSPTVSQSPKKESHPTVRDFHESKLNVQKAVTAVASKATPVATTPRTAKTVVAASFSPVKATLPSSGRQTPRASTSKQVNLTSPGRHLARTLAASTTTVSTTPTATASTRRAAPTITTTPILQERVVESLTDVTGLSENFCGTDETRDMYTLGHNHMEKRIELLSWISNFVSQPIFAGCTIGTRFKASHHYICDLTKEERDHIRDTSDRGENIQRAHISVIPNIPIIVNGTEVNLSGLVDYKGKKVNLHELLNVCDVAPTFINKIDDNVEKTRNDISKLLNKVIKKEMTSADCTLKMVGLFKKALKKPQYGIERGKIDANSPILSAGEDPALKALKGKLAAVNAYLRANAPTPATPASTTDSTDASAPQAPQIPDERKS